MTGGTNLRLRVALGGVTGARASCGSPSPWLLPIWCDTVASCSCVRIFQIDHISNKQNGLLKASVESRTRGYLAPRALVRCVELQHIEAKLLRARIDGRGLADACCQ